MQGSFPRRQTLYPTPKGTWGTPVTNALNNGSLQGRQSLTMSSWNLKLQVLFRAANHVTVEILNK